MGMYENESTFIQNSTQNNCKTLLKRKQTPISLNVKEPISTTECEKPN